VQLLNTIPLILTGEQPCGYLEGRLSCSLFIDPSVPLSPPLYGLLLANGFRRSGDRVYRPFCGGCSACMPVRLEVAKFSPNRSQQRCWNKNAATRAKVKPKFFDPVHYAMYQRYQLARHAGGDMANSTPDEYLNFLASSWCKSHFVEFCIDGKLAAVAVVDQVENALSAVYTFYEPDFSGFSLGTFAVLWQIQQARIWQCDYLYLGYWIKDCRKMAYKSQFKPIQGLIDNQWVDIASECH